MENIIKETKNHIEIYDYKGADYMPATTFGHWTVAFLNYAERFDPEKFSQVERHLETDEAFILLEGDATLITGEDLLRTKMEKHKIYNIPQGVWHHIITSRDAKVLIIENSDTSAENSEYKSI